MGYTIIMTPKDLKKWRAEHGYTQGQLAEALGVFGKITVSKWETGSRKIPALLPLALLGLETLVKKGGTIKSKGVKFKKGGKQ
jgi:transcriptional regulator with XRE-family HTH domain